MNSAADLVRKNVTHEIYLLHFPLRHIAVHDLSPLAL